MPDSLIPYLLAEAEGENGLGHDFLTELIHRFEEDDSAKPMIVNAVTGMSSQLSMISMDGSYTQYVQVRYKILVIRTIANIA